MSRTVINTHLGLALTPARSAPPQLLISVRNAAEARLVKSLGVAWIDLKDPDAGSLGAADAQTAQSVARELTDFPQRSAAIGELLSDAIANAGYFARYFPIVKVGLSGVRKTADWIDHLSELAAQTSALGAHIVPALYADHVECDAPEPLQVVAAAIHVRSPYVLIDTFRKEGRGLLDWLKMRELETIIESADAGSSRIVLAGSLTLHDLPKLAGLPIAAIAVRGSVCQGDRRSELSAKKVEQWVELFQNP